MRKTLLLVLALLPVLCFGQTNVFPASGNVGIGTASPQASLHVNGNGKFENNLKVLATDEGWAEGISIIKPSGWGGIRFNRNDPSTGLFNGNWAIGYTSSTGNDLSIANNYNNIQYNNILHISAATRNVGIGTASPTEKLSVKGKIRAQEIKVELTNWPDFVFAEDYQLPSLLETETHIREKGHLPGIPSAAEVKANGVELGDMNKKLLQKIEELTLYLIEMKKENERVSEINKKYEERLKIIEDKIK